MKMLTLRQLRISTQSFKPILIRNAQKVKIAMGKTKFGKDVRGIYKSIPAQALTREPGKKPHYLEARVYIDPKTKFLPVEMRPKVQHALNRTLSGGPKPYTGPEECPPFTDQSEVWVRCDCEWFLFGCEVAVARKNSAPLGRANGGVSNGQWYNGQTEGPHRSPNPQGVPNICKHLIALFARGALSKKS